MSTNTKYGGRCVLAVWVNGAVEYLPITGFAFTKALRQSDLGATQQKRSLLAPGSKSIVITESNSCQRSCNVVFLHMIPVDLATHKKVSGLQGNP